MPNLGVNFAGNTLYLPGVYYTSNASATQPTNAPATPPLVLIGYFYGLEPLVPQTFDASQGAAPLLAAIRGGPASGLVSFITSPSPQYSGAQSVTLINASANTQSNLTLQAAGSGVIVLESTDYGLPSNLLQAEVQAGTVAGIDLTLFDGYSGTTYQGNNLGVPFQVGYLGSASGVTLAVSGTNGAATNLIITSPTAGESVNVPLGAGQYQTITQVVEYLNGTGVYQANGLSDSGGGLAASSLSIVSGVALAAAASGVASYVNVNATLLDIVYWVNQYAALVGTASVSGSAQNIPSNLPSVIPLTHFSGATSVPPTNSTYAAAFNAALNTPAWTVVADSNAPAVVALGTQHAVTASEPVNGKMRRFFSGSSVGDTVATTLSIAQAQNSSTTTYCYPGITQTNTVTGLPETYGGLYVAAAEASIATANQIALPLTNKPLTGTGVEVALTNSQLIELQNGGVSVLFSNGGVPTILSDVTTWQTDNNPSNIYNQQIACRQWTGYTLIAALQPYVGGIASSLDIVRAKNAATKSLNSLIYTEGSNGVLNSWNPTSLVLTYSGSNQTLGVTVDAVNVGQNRIITTTVNVQPLSLSAVG